MASRAVAGLAGPRSRSRSQTASVLATSPFGCGGLALLPVRSLTKRVNRSSTSACEPSVARSGQDDHSFLARRRPRRTTAANTAWAALLPGEYIVLVPARQVVVAHALAREVQAGRLQSRRDLAAALSPEAKAIQAGDSLIALDGSPLPPPPTAERLFYPPTFHPSALTIDLTVPLTITRGRGTRRDRPAAATGANAARLGIRRGSRRCCGGHADSALAEGAR